MAELLFRSSNSTSENEFPGIDVAEPMRVITTKSGIDTFRSIPQRRPVTRMKAVRMGA